jgi:hypothetical protein
MHFLLKNAYPSETAHFMVLEQGIIKTWLKIKYSWNSILRGIYLMQKCQILNKITPLAKHVWGCPSTSGRWPQFKK